MGLSQRIRSVATLAVMTVGMTLSVRPTAYGQWIEFTDDTSTNLSTGLINVSDPLEKDIATGDLNRDGWEDVIVVRKVRFSNPGAKTDILLMNEDGVLVNRTSSLAPGFLSTPTDARDVFLADIDLDGWTDVIIANTFGQQPKLYRNLGEDADGTWLGLADESFRLPTIVIAGPLRFCAIWADDLTGNGAPDLYFSNYAGPGIVRTFDVLLINDGNGFFADQTGARLRGPLGDFSSVAFGTAVQMRDVDKDGDNDLIKISALTEVEPWNATGTFLLFNTGGGFFNTAAFQSISPQNDSYMFMIGLLDDDDMLDFYFQNDSFDRHAFITAVTPDESITFGSTPVVESQRVAGLGGNVKMVDVDGDGHLDVGVASVDTDIANCDTGEFALLRNAGGMLVDDFAEGSLAWHTPCFDFALMDINGDGLIDLFMGNCDGYKVFLQVDPLLRDCNANGTPDAIDVLSGPLDQWAGEVVAFSSQRGVDAHSAAQALGEPDTLTFGENESAWSPAVVNGSIEFLTLAFDAPVLATGVTIRETQGNGFVTRVDVLDVDDGFTTVWTGTDSSLPGAPVDFVVNWPQTDFSAVGVTIHVDTDHDPDREAIDAVRLHGIHVATSADQNNNSVPDECECDPPFAPTFPEMAVSTNRFLPFQAGNPGRELAVRVEFISMPNSHSALTGRFAWVGQPTDMTEVSSMNDTTPPTFKIAPLVCDPLFLDWSQIGPVHIYHRNLAPGSTYQLQLIQRDCPTVVLGNFSAPLLIDTSPWGDIARPDPLTSGFGPPDGSVDIGSDVLGALGKFQSAPGALSKVRTDLYPATPDFVISIADVLRVIDAFVGLPFSFPLDLEPLSGGPPCSP